MIVIFALTSVYLNPKSSISNKIKNLLPENSKQSVSIILKKTIFFFPELNKKNKLLESEIDILKSRLFYLEKDSKLKLSTMSDGNLKLNMNKFFSKEIFQKNDLTLGLRKYHLPLFMDSGKKARAYIEQTKENLILIRADANIFLISKKELNNNKHQLTKIESNIKEIIKDDAFYDNHKITQYGSWIGVKDILIDNNKLFLSYTKEIKNDCYNISILKADINLDYLNFENFFSHNECVQTNTKQTDYGNGWNLVVSGGRMTIYKNNDLLLSHGEFMNRPLAQNNNSLFGKIIKINLKNKKYKIFSTGHRNPQGLIYSSKYDRIIESEHGPKGGDEINIVEEGKNYGWPIASYGEHMGYSVEHKLSHKERLVLAPLNRSHRKFNFIEPILYFDQAVAPSQFIEIPDNFSEETKNKFILTSLKAQSLFFLKFNNDFTKILYLEQININERIRDIIYDKDKKLFYLIFENSLSLGILDNSKKAFNECKTHHRNLENSFRVDFLNFKQTEKIHKICKNYTYSPNHIPKKISTIIIPSN